MAKLESLITLELSLAKKLSNALLPLSRTIVDRVTELADAGDYYQAHQVIQQIDYAPALEKVRGYVEFIAVTSILLGRSNSTKGNKPTTKELDATDTQVVKDGVTLMLDGMARRAVLRIQKNAEQVLDQFEAARLVKEQEVKKAELGPTSFEGLALKLNSAVSGGTQAVVDINANLTTSRMISYGFISEQITRNVETFQISEVLDKRTCPVCEGMHG